MQQQGKSYKIGVMKIEVEKTDSTFKSTVDAAVAELEETLAQKSLGMTMELFEFLGPHLSPVEGAYSPFDFLQMGLTEKVERGFHFLLIITEVDLSPSVHSYVLALPSQLTRIGIVSTKRLSPRFWGEDASDTVTVQRLTTVMLHTLGHLLDLRHQPDPENIMYDFQQLKKLDQMRQVTCEQISQMQEELARNATEKIAYSNRWWFALQQIAANHEMIWHAVATANPLKLVLKLPTMATAALSVIIVLFFSPEIWDVASTVEWYQLAAFSLISMTVATLVLYRAYALRALPSRGAVVAESTVVTATATLLTLALALLTLYLAFFLLSYLGAAVFFPRKLMETWPTVDPAIRVLDHLKLGMFLAAMGVLTGSLGGRAENQDLIRRVLFIDEEV